MFPLAGCHYVSPRCDLCDGGGAYKMEAKLQGPEGRDDQHCNEMKRRVSNTLSHAAASHFGCYSMKQLTIVWL
jgi:hypothetical protein